MNILEQHFQNYLNTMRPDSSAKITTKMEGDSLIVYSGRNAKLGLAKYVFKLKEDSTQTGNVSMVSPTEIERSIGAEFISSLPDPKEFTANAESRYKEIFGFFRSTFTGDSKLHETLIPGAKISNYKLTLPQREAYEAYEDSLKLAEKEGLIVHPTGMGKGLLVANFAIDFFHKFLPIIYRAQNLKGLKEKQKSIKKGLIRKMPRVLILSHRTDLNAQIKESIDGLIDSSNRNYVKVKEFNSSKAILKEIVDPTSSIMITTRQSLIKAIEKGDIPADYFDFVMVDEAHNEGASEYDRIFEYIKPKSHVGFTASAWRSDQVSIVKKYKYKIIHHFSIENAMKQGYLTPMRYILMRGFEVSKKGLKLKLGDPLKHKNRTEETYGALAHSIVENQNPDNPGPTLIFNPSIEFAKELDKALSRIGARSEVYFSGLVGWFRKTIVDLGDGLQEAIETDPKVSRIWKWLNPGTNERKLRKRVKESFESGVLQFLNVVKLFTEGQNVRDIRTLVLLKHTQVKNLMLQILGRGARNSIGKRFVEIRDYRDNLDVILEALIYEKYFLANELEKAAEQGGSFDEAIEKLQDRNYFPENGEVIQTPFGEIIFSEAFRQDLFTTHSVNKSHMQRLVELTKDPKNSPKSLRELAKVSNIDFDFWLLRLSNEGFLPSLPESTVYLMPLRPSNGRDFLHYSYNSKQKKILNQLTLENDLGKPLSEQFFDNLYKKTQIKTYELKFLMRNCDFWLTVKNGAGFTYEDFREFLPPKFDEYCLQ